MRGNLFVLLALPLILVVLGSPRGLAQGTSTETVGFSINIEPVFVMKGSAEKGGNVELGPLRPGEQPAPGRATVSVRTNRGRPYRIVQRLEQNLLNEKGSDLSEEPVLFSATDGTRGGRSEAKAPVPLTTQPAILFSSNPEGGSDDFTVTYSVSSRQMVPAGSYRARVLLEEEIQ